MPSSVDWSSPSVFTKVCPVPVFLGTAVRKPRVYKGVSGHAKCLLS